MELQTDMKSPKIKMISNYHPHETSKLIWGLHKVQMVSNFPSPWNFQTHL